MERIKSPEREQNPVSEVEKFITRVWEHPLLDEATRLARKEALSEMEENMREVGYTADQYIGIIAGGLLWAVDTSSDYDFLLIDLVNEYQGGYVNGEETTPDHEVELTPKNEKIHVLRVRGKEFPSTSLDDPIIYHLLFTPDEYLAGNLEFAAALRLHLVDQMSQQMENWQDSASQASQNFDKYFRFWNNSNYGYPEAIAETDKRTLRFSQRLGQRSLQSQNPTYWKQQFIRSRSKLLLPSFGIYKDALDMTEGKLSTNPVFIADGIKNDADYSSVLY